MRTKNKLANVLLDFGRNEDGAVTVDWVVLTAAVCGIAIMVANMLAPVLFENAGNALAGDVSYATSVGR